MFTYIKPPEVKPNDMVVVFSLGEAMELTRELGKIAVGKTGPAVDQLYRGLLARVEKEGFKV